MSDLKDILVNALINAAEDGVMSGLAEAGEEFDRIDYLTEGHRDSLVWAADRLTQAIRDHVFDREKVRAALEETFKDLGVISAKVSPQPYDVDDVVDFAFADLITDRLIEALAGGSST